MEKEYTLIYILLSQEHKMGRLLQALIAIRYPNSLHTVYHRHIPPAAFLSQ